MLSGEPCAGDSSSAFSAICVVICVAGLLGAAVAGTVDRICMEVDLAEEADTLGCVVDSAAPPSPTSPASPAPPTAVLVVGACVVAAVVSESVVVAWCVAAGVVDSASTPSPTSPASPAPPTTVLVVGACVVAAVVSESVVVAWYVVVAATIVVVVGLGKAAVVCWASAHVPFLKTKT